jgi:hypothetical protein
VLITPKNHFQSFCRTHVPAESSQNWRTVHSTKWTLHFEILWSIFVLLVSTVASNNVGTIISLGHCCCLLTQTSDLKRLLKPEWISKCRINTSVPKKRAECIDLLFESLTSPLSMCTYWLHWDKILPELDWSNSALCWLMDVQTQWWNL